MRQKLKEISKGKTQEFKLRGTEHTRIEGLSDGPTLMLIYGVGAASIFICMALLYWHALRKTDMLKLNEIEIFDEHL